MSRVRTASDTERRPLRPAINPDARENQLITLALDLVEQRLRDGTASSQETTHFLKAASQKYQFELERIKLENELTAAKTKSIANSEEVKVLYENAIKAMKRYSGHEDEEDEYEEF